MKNLKKILALALVVAITATASIAGTLAYLTDRDSKANVFTVGDVQIELNDSFEQGSQLVPGVVVEKEASITNTGKNDAWVWLTLAVPTAFNDAAKPILTLSTATDQTWLKDAVMVGTDEINGKEYAVYTMLYNEVLAPKATTSLGLTEVTMDTHIDIDPEGTMHWVENGTTTELDWNINEDGNPVVYVSAYAIQTEGFDNVEDAYKAYGIQWGNNGTEYAEFEVVNVATEEALLNALTADEEHIVVSLEADLTYDVAAWEVKAMGGASTETITIIGNGNTLTFNHTNGDWNNVVTNNGATLVLSNVNLTNAGKNDGPWNRHDINFACDVEMTNVTSDKAFAFKAGAKLTDVTIADANTSDTYAIWVQPNGQTITLDNCVIDMLAATDGRGLKIDEQYVSAPEKVTLVVKDTTFKTEEKSAILVKSVAGADITLENVVISDVAADSTNPVWVDSASADYADLVTVTGGNKIVEP